MNHTCPKCGHQFAVPADAQHKGGKARWRGMSAKERSKAASEAARARWKVTQKQSD